MGTYLIKSDQRLMEAKSELQLERLVVTGLISRDALISSQPDGEWTRAEAHPATAHFFAADEGERTMIAVSPLHLKEADDASSDDEASQTWWVRTGVSTVEARGLDVLLRLHELGVIRADHEVGPTRNGPFVQLSEHPDLKSHFDGASSAAASSGVSSDTDVTGGGDTKPDSARRTRDGSVVIALSEEEIEYLQEESQRRHRRDIVPEERREVSNVIVLGAADIEVIDDDLVSGDMLVSVGVDSDQTQEEPLELEPEDIVVLSDDTSSAATEHATLPEGDSDVIHLGPDDIEEFEQIDRRRKLPVLDGSWDQFCRAMNLAARRVATAGHTQELTWDLFRSMMQRSGRRTGGPTESSWQRFQARLNSRGGVTPIPNETTWDRFRELMTEDRDDLEPIRAKSPGGPLAKARTPTRQHRSRGCDRWRGSHQIRCRPSR